MSPIPSAASWRRSTAKAGIGEVINIGSAFEISIGDTARMIAELMGVTIEIEQDDVRVRPERSEVDRLWASNAKAQKLLGWSPRFAGVDGLRKGLEQTIAWFARAGEPVSLSHQCIHAVNKMSISSARRATTVPPCLTSSPCSKRWMPRSAPPRARSSCTNRVLARASASLCSIASIPTGCRQRASMSLASRTMVAAATGSRHAVAIVNGTAALHAALVLEGVEQNDEVLLPSITFVATANAVSHAGADPAFRRFDLGHAGARSPSARGASRRPSRCRRNGDG